MPVSQGSARRESQLLIPLLPRNQPPHPRFPFTPGRGPPGLAPVSPGAVSAPDLAAQGSVSSGKDGGHLCPVLWADANDCPGPCHGQRALRIPPCVSWWPSHVEDMLLGF